MTLQEALTKAGSNKLIVRQKWLDEGSSMRLYTSNKIIDLINIKLTEESVFADDWKLFTPTPTTTTGDK